MNDQPECQDPAGESVHSRTGDINKIAFHPDVTDVAELLCLPGSVCDIGTFGNQGPWSEVSIETR